MKSPLLTDIELSAILSEHAVSHLQRVAAISPNGGRVCALGVVSRLHLSQEDPIYYYLATHPGHFSHEVYSPFDREYTQIMSPEDVLAIWGL